MEGDRVNEQIVTTLTRALSNPGANGLPNKPGLCLAFVRAIVERAYYGGRWMFYSRFLVAGTTRRPGDEAERLDAAERDPWAADIEASMKALGLAVPALLRKPGDLVFNHNAAKPYGHVGVLLNRCTIVELIDPDFRPRSVHLPGNISLTPYGDWPVTLVARLRPR